MNNLFVIVLIAVVLIGVLSLSRRKRSGIDFRPSPSGMRPRPVRSGGPAAFRLKPPAGLGTRPGHPAEAAARRLEAAIDAGFEARVLERVRQAHPSLGEGELSWAWFELKRFFLMTCVLREVNMYSSRVDDVWHEMLMFTREYEDFGRRLSGATIHHAPHGAEAAAESPAARPWFDWVYGELFVIYPESERLWGPFFRRPLPAELIAELERSTRGELLADRFNARAAEAFPDLRETADALIAAAKAQIEQGHARMDGEDTAFGRGGWDPSGVALMSGALMFASMSGPEVFEQQMNEFRPKEEDLSQKSDGGGYAYGGDYGSNDGNDSGSDNGGGSDGGAGGGGDSGGGSSCGSSCGGGGCGSS